MKVPCCSLKRRVLLPLLLMGAGMGAVLAASSYGVLRDAAERVGDARAESLGRSIENAAQVTATTGELQRYVAALAAEEDVGLALVVAGDPETVVASSRRSLIGLPSSALSSEAQASLNAARHSRSRVDGDRHSRIAVSQAVLPGLQFSRGSLLRGLVLVELRAPPLEREIQTLALAILAGVAALTVVWATQTARLLRRYVLTPVATLHGLVQEEQSAQPGEGRGGGDELRNLHECVVAAFRQRREALAALAKARDAAESGARARTEFLAVMSHEIRTPLNGVLGVAQLLKKTPLDREQVELVEVMQESGESLLVILNDILDLTKIESDRLSLEQTAFSIASLLAGVRHLFAPAAQAKGLTLHVGTRALPPQVVGDPTRLRQVLLNLVSNAIKFTNSGRVTLSVCGEAGGHLRFEVEDTGVGIPAEHLPRLFDKFSQADASTTRKFGGTGLGMAIASRLVRMMGGELTVASVVGQGTRATFSLVLPTTIAPCPEPRLHTGTAMAAASSAPLRVLAAEDQDINRFVLRRVLEGLRCQVTLAKDGHEAVALFEQAEFDIVLMDCRMPGLDGYEAARRIRRLEAGAQRRRTPVVALTASAMVGDHAQCLEAGMDECLTKPIRAEQLARVLEQARLTGSVVRVG